MATGMTVRCRRGARCRQCTGKRLSRTIWSSFNKDQQTREDYGCLGVCSGVLEENFGKVPGLDGPNRQSPIASVQRTRSTLASHSAVPHGTNVARTNANRAI